MELYKSLIFRRTKFSWQAPKNTCTFDHNHCHSITHIQEPQKLAWVSLEANIEHIFLPERLITIQPDMKKPTYSDIP